MPVKWKFFLALNFIVGLPAFILLILLILAMGEMSTQNKNFFEASLVTSAVFIIAANSFLNVFLLQRFFPDKLIPGRIKKLSWISLLVTTISTTGLLIAGIYGAYLAFNVEYPREGNLSGKIALIIFIFGLVLKIAVLILQGQLPVLVNRNHREKIHSMIDSIGQ